MLRESAILKYLQQHAADSQLAAPLLVHMRHVVDKVTTTASMLAKHCGKTTVGMKDVAQATTPVCVTCAEYDAGSNTCTVLASAARTRTNAPTQVGGALYDGWCGGHQAQCGVVKNATCLFAGGGGRHSGRRSQRRQRLLVRAPNTPGGRPCTCASSRHAAAAETHKAKASGGLFDYSGFCGDHSALTQCTHSDNLGGASSSGGTCSGGGRRTRTRTSRARTRRQKGGMQMYTGFCDSHPTQCQFADTASMTAAASSMPCSGGGGGGRGLSRSRSRKRSVRRKRRGGGVSYSDGYDTGGGDGDKEGETYGAAPQMMILTKTAVTRQMQEQTNMHWTANAVSLLEDSVRYHFHEVVNQVNALEGVPAGDALAQVIQSYKL